MCQVDGMRVTPPKPKISPMEEENKTEKKRKGEKRRKRKRKRKEGRKEKTVCGKEGRREKREKKENEEKGKEEGEKGRRTGCSPSIFRRSADQGVGIVHAPRGRGFSYSGYYMLKGHSMATGFGLNHRASS